MMQELVCTRKSKNQDADLRKEKLSLIVATIFVLKWCDQLSNFIGNYSRCMIFMLLLACCFTFYTDITCLQIARQITHGVILSRSGFGTTTSHAGLNEHFLSINGSTSSEQPINIGSFLFNSSRLGWMLRHRPVCIRPQRADVITITSLFQRQRASIVSNWQISFTFLISERKITGNTINVRHRIQRKYERCSD